MSDNKTFYVPKIQYDEINNKRHCYVLKVFGDKEGWSGKTFDNEGDAYVFLQIYILKKQKEELNEIIVQSLSKGIEAFPSLEQLFKQMNPNFEEKLIEDRRKALNIFLDKGDEF